MNEEDIRLAFVLSAQSQCKHEDIDVDDNARVSLADEWQQAGGAYVQAWVWVPTPDSLKNTKENT